MGCHEIPRFFRRAIWYQNSDFRMTTSFLGTRLRGYRLGFKLSYHQQVFLIHCRPTLGNFVFSSVMTHTLPKIAQKCGFPPPTQKSVGIPPNFFPPPELGERNLDPDHECPSKLFWKNVQIRTPPLVCRTFIFLKNHLSQRQK